MILCLDIGGSHIKAAVFRTVDDEPRAERRPTPHGSLDDFVDAVAALKADLAPGALSVALSLTGIVDPDTSVLSCANIPAIHGSRIGAALEARLQCPVRIANDAECFALAESRFGAGRGHANVFPIILGSGIGGAQVLNGRLVPGAGGFSGEWGHAPIIRNRAGEPAIDIPDLQCGCGQHGCLNTVGGARGIETLARLATGAAHDSRAIIDGFEAGDRAMGHVVSIWSDLVSRVLALTVNITGASIVPAAGGLANSEALLDRLDRETRARILRKTETPLVVRAHLASEPGLKGAAILGFSEAH